MLRLSWVVLLPLIGLRVTIGWVVATWVVPAALLVVVVNCIVFMRPTSLLRRPHGDHEFDPRSLVSFLGVEQASSMIAGLAGLAVPAYTLSVLGSHDAAPFLAAYSLIVVAEGTIASVRPRSLWNCGARRTPRATCCWRRE